jgi:hypothetical protein
LFLCFGEGGAFLGEIEARWFLELLTIGSDLKFGSRAGS